MQYKAALEFFERRSVFQSAIFQRRRVLRFAQRIHTCFRHNAILR